MAFEPPIAVFDACIFHPFHLWNIVVQAAVDRVVEGRCTDAIHDEWIRNLAADVPAIPIARLENARRLINEAVPTAMAAGASTIVTNVRHFPLKELKKFGVRRESPDAFLADLYDQAPELMIDSLANARRILAKTRVPASDFIAILNNQGLVLLSPSG